MRRLIVVRHAKAEGSAASDRARSLTARGRADATALGIWMAASGMVPDAALVSTARRTEETWHEMGRALEGVAAQPCEMLYQAQVPQVLALVAGTASAVGNLAVIGHNPTMHELAAALVREGGEVLTGGFPTAAAAVIDFAVDDWQEVGFGGGRLAAFVTPDQLKSEIP